MTPELYHILLKNVILFSRPNYSPYEDFCLDLSSRFCLLSFDIIMILIQQQFIVKCTFVLVFIKIFYI